MTANKLLSEDDKFFSDNFTKLLVFYIIMFSIGLGTEILGFCLMFNRDGHTIVRLGALYATGSLLLFGVCGFFFLIDIFTEIFRRRKKP